MQFESPRCFSLFSGAGGCSLGFAGAGFKILLAIDSDRASCETYSRNFPGTEVRNADMRSVDWGATLRDHHLAPGELEMLIGGPPCQGFSTAGRRMWDDPRNDLLQSYVEALRTIRPRWFLMENVEGLLTLNDGDYLLGAVEAFVDLGYRVRLEKVYAHEYGVPQRRKRVIVVGNLLGIDFHFPPSTTPIGGAIFRQSRNTFEAAVGTLPHPLEVTAPGDAEGASPQGHWFLRQSGINRRRIERLLPGQTMKDLPDELQHESFKRRAFRRVADGTPSEKRGGAPSGLKRLVAGEPSLTITGAAIREFVHPSQDRCLTIRECARLQSFPDDFVFCGSTADQIQQVGNAIPPVLAREFASHIKDKLGFATADPDLPGALLGFSLTKADAMSPSLRRTHSLLEGLSTQPSLFAF